MESNLPARLQGKDHAREQLEKEIPWRLIPPEKHEECYQAESKEHLSGQAIEVLDLEASRAVKVRGQAEDPPKSTPIETNLSRRRLDSSLPWRAKARLVVGGNVDPPLMALQAAWRTSPRWQALTGDIQAGS